MGNTVMPPYNTQPDTAEVGLEQDLLFAHHYETQPETVTTEKDSEVFKTPEQRDNEYCQMIRISGHRVAVARQQRHDVADSHEFALAA